MPKPYELTLAKVNKLRNWSSLDTFTTLLFLLLLVLMCSSCNTTNTQATSIDASTVIGVPQVTTTTLSSYPVKVYFSKKTISDFTTVFPVDRVAPTSGVGTFAIQQLIAGPTATESSAGYISEVHDAIYGPSNCTTAGQNFTLVLNKKGTQDQPGSATLRFCRALSSAGIGDDARVISEVDSTLLQFSTIKKVIILTNTDHCFGDESGLDRCLQ